MIRWETTLEYIAEVATDASIIAVHTEAVNHWNLSWTDLRVYAEDHDFANRLYVPKDGESISL
ncbi:hypothetical protein [Exiguobacterium qingdaonense]|uniref:hypothetical protein n=1 Tax=Exiguobacterium qingdaonense TaxID=2751251 RepID=UPI001BE74B2E|nr:hypothetical protein [Exiguobacterium qingdaonense]